MHVQIDPWHMVWVKVRTVCSSIQTGELAVSPQFIINTLEHDMMCQGSKIIISWARSRYSHGMCCP